MKSPMQNIVWDLVELPNGRSTVGCKLVFKEKSDALEKLRDTERGLYHWDLHRDTDKTMMKLSCRAV